MSKKFNNKDRVNNINKPIALITMMVSFFLIVLCIFNFNKNTVVDEIEQDFSDINTFIYSDYGSFGAAVATGYIEINDVPYCSDNASCNLDNADWIDKVVSFHVTDTKSEHLLLEIDSLYDSNYDGEKTITLGCVNSKNNISYLNAADEFTFSDDNIALINLSADISSKILSSSINNPITLKLEKSKLSHDVEIPSCYSDFTKVDIFE